MGNGRKPNELDEKNRRVHKGGMSMVYLSNAVHILQYTRTETKDRKGSDLHNRKRQIRKEFWVQCMNAQPRTKILTRQSFMRLTSSSTCASKSNTDRKAQVRKAFVPLTRLICAVRFADFLRWCLSPERNLTHNLCFISNSY